jgi:hypothetical protein
MVIAGGISLIGVVLIGFFITAIVVAIVRPPLHGSRFNWLAALGLLLLTMAMGVVLINRYRSLEIHRAEQTMHDEIVQLESHVFTPDVTGIDGSAIMTSHGPPASWSQSQIHTTKAWGVLFIATFIPFVIFLITRLTTRAIRGGGDAHRSGSGWSWVAAGLVCFLIFGGWVGARATWVHTSGSPMPVDVAAVEIGGHDHRGAVAQTQPTPYTGQVPIDELWERLNASQIPVTTSTTSDLVQAEESPEAESDSEQSSGTEADHGDAASHTVGDDPFVGEGESPWNSGRPNNRYEKLGGDDAPPFDGSKTKTAPAPRPDWVAQPPRMVGGVQRVVLQAGPYTTLQECYTQLRAEMREAVADHLGELVREATANPSPWVPELASMGITDGYIIRELLIDQFVEDGEASFGLTKTAWGLVEFPEYQDQRLLDSWKRHARRDRVAMAVLGSAVVLIVLGGAFALLKIDTWTRGYYTKRLFLGVPAAIIASIVAFSCFISVVG